MPQNLDDVHGQTIVAHLDIQMDRAGNMRIAGSITDEKFALFMLDTARDTIKNYHVQQKLGNRSAIIVPAYDTALVGTNEEKLLLNARHELSDIMSGK
jgi:hypothetical protein